ncbi:cilia- and flagella-associated protein 299-like [Arctopsyche grandis]|uniref:cilia- and flagella-associated protein 299-like n=1 Tax=Arctopsyche grandis TaxID=121162 RepID=UPI00406D6FED
MENEKDVAAFETFEDYLDSYISMDDAKYLGVEMARAILQLNFRQKVLSEKHFYAKKSEYIRFNVSSGLEILCCDKEILCKDQFLRELAARERGNLTDTIQTIIFIICKSWKGHIISGYIDYAENLRRNDWSLIFTKKKKLWPKPFDLSYFDWNSNVVHYNSTKNFDVIMEKKGLIFRSKIDESLINVDPNRHPGSNTTRTYVTSSMYELVVLFDHTSIHLK